VYYHAGPSFAKAHPDFVKHDENGKPLMGRWHFPELDFENPDLREYLWKNMEYFIRDFDADGYRCDVGDAVPLDFWAEGRRRMEKIKKEIYFISESEIAARNTDQIETFDGNYGFSWGYQAYTFTGSMPAQYLRQIWRERKSESPQGALFFYALENHDIANDSYERRFEKEWGGNAVEAALFMNFMMDGIPFLYNGEEYGDSARHSIFSLPGQMYIDRTHAGSERLAFIRALSDFHHTEKALYDGILNWLDEELPVNNSIMAWERVKDDERIIICVNTCGKMQNAVLHTLYNREQSRILMNHRAEFRMENECLHVQLMPYGFFAVKEKIN